MSSFSFSFSGGERPDSHDDRASGPQPIPPEAYSRMTRDLATVYAPLAPAARDVVRRLSAEYNVVARDVLDSERERFARVTEAVVLVPADERAPQLTMAWTDFRA